MSSLRLRTQAGPRSLALLLGLAPALAPVAWPQGARTSISPAPLTRLTTVRVAAGLDRPVQVVSAPGDFGRIFLVERGGTIRVSRNGELLPAPFLDLRTAVAAGHDDQGLLSLAFHPRWTDLGFFFVAYTRLEDGALVVERFAIAAGEPDRADPETGVTVLAQAQPTPANNGGDLKFGPDGHLYVALGDGGVPGDPDCRAQDGQSLLGKLLRLDVDGALPYGIPFDNPFLCDPRYRDEIWAVGLRHPRRFAFDRETGDLYLGDAGRQDGQEIDYLPAGSHGAENLGWKVMEGDACGPGKENCPPLTPSCDSLHLTPPLLDYDHASFDAANCAVTGGFVYRGCAVPDLRGTYFFADYCSGKILSMRPYAGRVLELRDRTRELTPPGGLVLDEIASFGEDAHGELYVVDAGGEVYGIVPDPPPARELDSGETGSHGRVPTLEVLGQLIPGRTADLFLHSAPPNTPVVLFLSPNARPRPLGAGTWFPAAPAMTRVRRVTDEKGQVTIPDVSGDLGPMRLYAQVAVRDAGLPLGIGASNALLVTWWDR